MSALAKTESSTATNAASAQRWLRPAMWALTILAILATARALSGANELTSIGTIQATLVAAVPIAMAGLGGLWSERVGVVNIGLEGMMILGTFGAGWIGWQHGPWAGVLAGVLMGALGGLIHAIATVTFGVDHIVSGVAINILALGGMAFLGTLLLSGTPGGGESQSPPVRSLGTFDLPGFSQIGSWLGEQGWWLISDLGNVLAGLDRKSVV